jgi:sugar diacid utilization regulator/putative methionine-R-sulfoxide reductase with GAF domain
VRLLSEASAVHACFVYLVERDQKRLVLRAASEPYAALAGAIELKRGEGLAWWVLEQRKAAFIRDHALDDPRVKYVPELEEERFQSLVAVPVLGRRGELIGAITLDTEAPREFTDAEAEFLVSSASLVAGAIENARMFDETRRRVSELELLTELAEVVAAADALDELAAEVVERGRDLLAATGVHLYLLDPDDERLHLRSSTASDAPAAIGLAELGPEVGRSARTSRLAVSLVVGGELLGALVATGTREVDLARAVANQTAVAIKKIQVLERLTEKNLIRDFFEDIAARRVSGALEGRAARLGCDLDAPHVVLAATHADDALERALASAARGSVLERRDQALRALVPVPPEGETSLLGELRRAHAALAEPPTIGVSSVCVGPAALAEGLEEARHALVGAAVMRHAPAVLSYDELGPYKYLLRIALDAEARDSTIDAIGKLDAYDRERGSSLLKTLEEFLARRGNISATSEALFVHQNTLRQRLRRIADLTGLDLRRDDWLMVEIAVKLVRLRGALEIAAPHT